MKVYSVPPDVNEKEKIIGGVLNINQFFWILGGLIIGALGFVLTYPIFGKGALFVGGLLGLTGVPFVVVKVKELTLFEYLKRNREFKKKTKYLPNERTKYDW